MSFEDKTVGQFPNVRHEFQINQCNHCENAPCVRGCPTRAMHKTAEGLTMHNPKKCIGCRTCMVACPYRAITANHIPIHPMYQDDKPLIPGGTSSGKELTGKMKAPIPTFNPALDNAGYLGIRKKGIVEKCTFCFHRLAKGLQPRCVEACPAQARLLGDLDNPNDPIHELMGKYPTKVRRPERGTKPKVFYLRSY